MSTYDYLKQFQPHILTLFERATIAQKWSHAYLIHGPQTIPLKAIAIFLAQSRLCEHPNPLADETCSICQRIQHEDYADFRLIDGQQTSIKKQDILDLESTFSLTSLEAPSRSVYILHHVENMTPEAVNALLKFLEEPSIEVYAFLTTHDVDALLPTIRSRSQVIQCKPVSPQKRIAHLMSLSLSEIDAQILHQYEGSDAEIVTFSQTSAFTSLKQLLIDWIENMTHDKSKNMFIFRDRLLGSLQKDQASLLLSWFLLLYTDAHHLSYQQPIILTAWQKTMKDLRLYSNPIGSCINATEQAIQHLQLNVHLQLVLNDWAQQCLKE
jgi:DNA polymerase-3 subunit delta'